MPAANESRSRPPSQRYGITDLQLPTPNVVDDLIIVEDKPIGQNYTELLPGTPHPTQTAAKLCREEVIADSGGEQRVRRVYATARKGEDAWNAALRYVDESASHPIYIRTYTVLRSQYTATARGTALSGLVGVIVTAGGTTSQTGRKSLSFSGGTGSGAVGYAELVGGTIVSAIITEKGTYTALPTISVSGVSGSTLTGVLQPSSAILVSETAEPAEGDLYSLFFRVTRAYKTLPGPVLPTKTTDEYGVSILRTKQDVLASTALGTFGTGVLTSEIAAVDSVQAQRLETKTASGGEYPDVNVRIADDGLHGVVTDTRKITTAGASGSTLGAETGGGFVIGYQITKTSNPDRVATVVTAVALPGPERHTRVVDERGVRLLVTEQDIDGDGDINSTYGTGVIAKESQAIDSVRSTFTVTQTLDGAAYPDVVVLKENDGVHGHTWQTDSLVALTDPSPPIIGDTLGGQYIVSYAIKKTKDPNKNLTTTTAVTLPGPERTGTQVDERGVRLLVVEQDVIGTTDISGSYATGVLSRSLKPIDSVRSTLETILTATGAPYPSVTVRKENDAIRALVSDTDSLTAITAPAPVLDTSIGACTISGAALISAVSVNGTYPTDGTSINGKPRYLRTDGLFDLTWGGSSWDVRGVPDLGNFWYGGVSADDPSSAGLGFYQASGGGATGGPCTVTLDVSGTIEGFTIRKTNDPDKNLTTTRTVALPGPERVSFTTERGVRLKITKQDVAEGTDVSIAGTGVISIDLTARSSVVAEKTTVQTADGAAYPTKRIDSEWSDVGRGQIWTHEYRTAAGASEPTPGTVLTLDGVSRVILGGVKVRPSDDPATNWTTIRTLAASCYNVPFVQYEKRGWNEPGNFDWLVAEAEAVNASELNRPGYVFNNRVPRGGKYTHKIVTYLLNGAPAANAMPQTFNGIDSPAASSSVFPVIRANTAHSAFIVIDENGPREKFEASTPPSYDRNNTYLVDADCPLWDGTTFRLTLAYVCAAGFPSAATTAAVFIRSAIFSESSDGGLNDPEDKTRLVFDGQAGDVFTVWGTDPSIGEVTETWTLDDTGPHRSTYQYNLIYAVRIDSNGSTQPAIRATGVKHEFRFDFTDNPDAGETWTFTVVGAQYSPAPYGYTFVNWFTVSGGATLNGVAVDGDYYRNGTSGGQLAYYRTDGVFTLFYNIGDAKYRLDSAGGSGSNYFKGGAIGDPATLAGAYSTAVGVTTGTPVVTLIAITGANKIRREATVDLTKANLIAALNDDGENASGVGGGTTFYTSSVVPFFSGETAETHATVGRILLTDRTAYNHTLTYTGTAGGSATNITSGRRGAFIAPTQAEYLAGSTIGDDQYRYNEANLYNADRRQVIPPSITNAVCQTINLLSSHTITVHYVMSGEVSVEYQLNGSGGFTALETVTGENVEEFIIAGVTSIIFRVSNSATDEKMLRLWITYS